MQTLSLQEPASGLATGLAAVQPVLSAAPAASTAQAPALDPVRPADLALGVAGWVGLGLVGLSTADVSHVTGAALVLAAPAGATLLTVPALLVGHQYLALKASPASLLSALLSGFTGSGRVAVGLLPLALGFAATTDFAPILSVLALLGVSFHALLLTMGRLERIESQGGESDAGARARMGLLVLAWAALYALIGLRLSWNVLAYTLHF